MREREYESIRVALKKEILEQLDCGRDFTDAQVRALIDEKLCGREYAGKLGVASRRAMSRELFSSIRGLDLLQELLEDSEITEIMINGPHHVFIEQNGRLFRKNVSFGTNEKLENVILNIVSKVNRTVNEANPIVDARLLDGSRANVVLPPIALDGPTVTIRKFPEDPMTMERLIGYGSLTPEVAEVLERMVQAKYNIFISGGTGSGKTTFLNALSNYIPKDERVITIEDSAELQIEGVENLVRLETRNANMEGKGEVTIRDLIRSSLRMRPERIIVGEVRGAEALDMLQAMNTGHDGSLSTGHSNSTKDMLSRLETMVISGNNIPIEAIRQQIASALDIIIQLSRLRDKSRRTLEITEVVGYENGEIQLNPLYRFVEHGEDENGRIIGGLERTDRPLINKYKFQMAGLPDTV